ncbi:TonB-dependent receptor [Chryseobacterium sp. Leaf404]|nr:TonB-dependent receptor [Chryseobacterium sp. Leaf404]
MLVFCSAAWSVHFCYGQEKDIETVYIFDNQMNKVKLFHKVSSLSLQDIQKNSTNISEVLRFQTPVYIKENGRGAVSSPSFRGTTAQQTAFVWNGININSMFLGQADINNISFWGMDQVDVKSGGGSVIYGSGAIGGSIHLNNVLGFNKGFQGNLFSEAGSFGTYNNFLQGSFSDNRFSFKASGNYSFSENDYTVPESRNYINRNGQYENSKINISAAYRLNKAHQISWISEFFNANQHFPVFFDSATPTKYETQNIRSLISWDWTKARFNNSLKIAYTEENFQYFSNLDQPKTSGGSGRNYIAKNSFNYFFNEKWNANILTEFQVNEGEGFQSGIKNVSRNVGSAGALLRYFPNSKLRAEVGIKKDFVENVSSPVLYSFSGGWDISKHYSLGISISKNFRFPSFNDLYWQPGGNENLKSESSHHFELNNQIKISDFYVSITPYYMKIKDLISWIPSPMGYSAPSNTANVESYGVESQLDFKKVFGKNTVSSTLGYTYSKSEDLETNKQLRYVPLHKFFGTVNYQYSFVKLFIQGMYNGLTYTESTEKRSDALEPYFVANAGVSATLKKKFTLGFKANNIFDEIYETTAYYPLPKRNYSIYLNINF